MQPFCPMLPPFANEHGQNQSLQVNAPMAHLNHCLYYQLHHLNPRLHYSTNHEFQNLLTTQPIAQLPQHSFLLRKTTVKKAQADISILN